MWPVVSETQVMVTRCKKLTWSCCVQAANRDTLMSRPSAKRAAARMCVCAMLLLGAANADAPVMQGQCEDEPMDLQGESALLHHACGRNRCILSCNLHASAMCGMAWVICMCRPATLRG